jgi:hypothetical protein
LVRPLRGSQSAGLIIWFEKSGGRGFDKDLFREPRPRHFVSKRENHRVVDMSASAENVYAAVFSSNVGNVAHLEEETRFYHAGQVLEFLVDYFWSA